MDYLALDCVKPFRPINKANSNSEDFASERQSHPYMGAGQWAMGKGLQDKKLARPRVSISARMF